MSLAVQQSGADATAAALGNDVRGLRKSRGLTQNELALKIPFVFTLRFSCLATGLFTPILAMGGQRPCQTCIGREPSVPT